MRRALLLAGAALALIAASDPVPPGQEVEHVVQPGETLGGIANRAGVPRILIAEANRLQPPYTLRAGQKLAIPRTRHHTVARGETGFTIAYNYAVPWNEIAVANGLEPTAPLRPGQKLLIPTVLDTAPSPAASSAAAPAAAAASVAPNFRWPLSGPVRRDYAPRSGPNYHDGLDIRAAEGTAVRAVAQGTVLFAGSEPTQFGNMVVIDHGDGWHSAYAFLNRVTVKQGDAVSAGERVGLVGHTGRAKGNELHFEIRRNNRPVDPADKLPAAASTSSDTTATR